MLTVYFGTNNDVFGKRRQILTFVENLPNEGLGLGEWIKAEHAAISESEKSAKEQQSATEAELAAVKQRDEHIAMATKTLVSGLTASTYAQRKTRIAARLENVLAELTTTTAPSINEVAVPAAPSLPGSVGRFLDDSENAAAMQLFTLTGSGGLPDASKCDTLELTILNDKATTTHVLSNIDACRRSILEWAVHLSANAEKKLKTDEDELQRKIFSSDSFKFMYSDFPGDTVDMDALRTMLEGLEDAKGAAPPPLDKRPRSLDDPN